MDTGTITSFDRLISSLDDKKDQGLLLSLAYDPHASQQQLQIAISSAVDRLVAQHPGMQVNIEDIVDTAPKGELYEIEHQDFEQEEHKRQSDYSHSGPAGELVDHEKFQSDILDSLAKEHQESAIDELNAIRKSDESGWEKQRLIVEKFRDILTRNATAEGTLQEQQDLLAKQLEEAKIGKQIDRTDENGNVMLDKEGNPVKTTDTAQAIRKRSFDLSTERTQERKELSDLQERDIVKEHLKLEQAQDQLSQLDLRRKSLTFEEQAQRTKLQDDIKKWEKNIRGRGFSSKDKQSLTRFLELRSQHNQLNQTDIKNIDRLVQRFSRLTIPEQDALLGRILSRQHRHTRGELWKVFDQKDRGKLTGLYKKTLTRAQRRHILNFQKLQLQKRALSMQRPTFNPNLFRRFYNMIAPPQSDSSWTTNPDNSQQSSDGFNPIDSINNVRNNINNAKRILDAFKGLGGGGGAGAGAGGAAGAGAGAWPVIVIIIIVFVLLIIIVVMFVLLPHGGSNEKVTGVTCGDAPTEASALNAETFETTLFNRYGVDVIVDPTFAKDHTNVLVEKQIYSDVCLLFGDDASSDLTKRAVLNTFGNLTVGTDAQRGFGNGGFQAMRVQYYVLPEDPKSTCSITKAKQSSSSEVYWDINNPLECLSQPGVFDFLFAQNLAQNLILQQQHLHNGSSDVFNNFKNIVFSSGDLPTQTCSTTEKPENCFSDMVAAYLTWGVPFTSSSAAKDTTQSPSTATNSASLAELLGGVGVYPKTYPSYYDFAQANLFDNLEFFSTNTFNSSLLDKFVADVQACQGPSGDTQAPDVACVRLIQKNETGTLAQALANVSSNYQCGQFIWSVQTLYNWDKFQSGDGAGVSSWYFYDIANHRQKGYEWIPNPFANGVQNSATTSADIQEGDIFIYTTAEPSGDTGHIAVVKSVEDGFHITAEESNWHEDADGLPVVTDTRNLTLDQRLRSNGSVVLRGWWRKTNTVNGGS